MTRYFVLRYIFGRYVFVHSYRARCYGRATTTVIVCGLGILGLAWDLSRSNQGRIRVWSRAGMHPTGELIGPVSALGASATLRRDQSIETSLSAGGQVVARIALTWSLARRTRVAIARQRCAAGNPHRSA